MTIIANHENSNLLLHKKKQKKHNNFLVEKLVIFFYSWTEIGFSDCVSILINFEYMNISNTGPIFAWYWTNTKFCDIAHHDYHLIKLKKLKKSMVVQ